MRSVEFDYRLPVTFVRAAGTVSTSTDVDGKATTEYKVAITTERGADLRTRCHVSLDAQSLATQKATWNLTADGRLTGADVALTAAPLARWSAGLQLGATAVGIAGPALLAAGPLGWIGLAGLAGAATLGGAALAGGMDLSMLVNNLVPTDNTRAAPPSAPAEASPSDWNVHSAYVQEHAEDAQQLANLRSCLAVAARAQARAARAVAMTDDPIAQEYWEARATQLGRLLASASVGAAHAEAAYATWIASKITVTVDTHDVRLPIDLFPTRAQLENWAAGGDTTVYSQWAAMVADLRTAVSVDLVPPGDVHVERDLEFMPGASDDEVHYRPPRQAVLRVWKAVPKTGLPGQYTLDLSESSRIAVSCPGNETRISIQTNHDVTNAVAVTFDDSGGLTKVVTDLRDRTVERSAELSGLVSKIGDSVTAGKDLRAAVAPPSLTTRAAEAKAAAELGLVPGQDDPLKDLKAQLEEAQLRAQLKLAEQIQASTSVPVFVSMTTSS